MNGQFIGIGLAFLVNVAGILLLRFIRNRDADKNKRDRVERRFQILQDRYGFDLRDDGEPHPHSHRDDLHDV